VVANSGKRRWVHWRWACPKFLRQTFHEWALHSIAYSDWAREYYEQQRAKGKRRNTAIRSLAFKWIRILFRWRKDGTPYDKAAYQLRMAARRPNQQATTLAVELQWKKVAGFSKFFLPRFDGKAQMSILRFGTAQSTPKTPMAGAVTMSIGRTP